MKKYFLFIFVGFVALCGCKKDYADPADPMTYDVTVSRAQAYRVWVDLYPSDEFFDYDLYALPVDSFDKKFGSDAAYLEYCRKTYNKSLMFQGAYIGHYKCDYDNTKYYLLIVPFSNGNPTALRKVEFSTKSWNPSHFVVKESDFSIDSLGNITLTPADNATHYFWDFEMKNVVDKRFMGTQSLWFFRNIIYYYAMDFFPDLEITGPSVYNLFDYFDPKDLHTNDTLCISAVGYQNEVGETSDCYYNFQLIYNEKVEDSKIVKSPTDRFEYVFRPVNDWPDYIDESTSPKRNTAKASKWSPKQYPAIWFDRTDKYIPRHIRSVKH